VDTSVKIAKVPACPFTKNDSGSNCERLDGIKHLHRPVFQICCASKSVVLLANADADLSDSALDGDTLTNWCVQSCCRRA